MENKQTIKKTSFEVAEDLKVKFDVACKQRRILQKEGIRQAIEAWLDGTTGTAKEPERVLSGQELTPSDRKTELLFMSLLESSALNSKLDTILKLFDKQAHGKDQGRTDRRNTERELARLIKEEIQAGSDVEAAGKSGKTVRGRSKDALPTPRTRRAG